MRSPRLRARVRRARRRSSRRCSRCAAPRARAARSGWTRARAGDARWRRGRRRPGSAARPCGLREVVAVDLTSSKPAALSSCWSSRTSDAGRRRRAARAAPSAARRRAAVARRRRARARSRRRAAASRREYGERRETAARRLEPPFWAPTGLAVGLARKGPRYIALMATIRPGPLGGQWVPRSPQHGVSGDSAGTRLRIVAQREMVTATTGRAFRRFDGYPRLLPSAKLAHATLIGRRGQRGVRERQGDLGAGPQRGRRDVLVGRVRAAARAARDRRWSRGSWPRSGSRRWRPPRCAGRRRRARSPRRRARAGRRVAARARPCPATRACIDGVERAPPTSAGIGRRARRANASAVGAHVEDQLAGGGDDVERVARCAGSSARRSAGRARRVVAAGDRLRGARPARAARWRPCRAPSPSAPSGPAARDADRARRLAPHDHGVVAGRRPRSGRPRSTGRRRSPRSASTCANGPIAPLLVADEQQRGLGEVRAPLGERAQDAERQHVAALHVDRPRADAAARPRGAAAGASACATTVSRWPTSRTRPLARAASRAAAGRARGRATSTAAARRSASSGASAAATAAASSAPRTSPEGDETRDERLELALGARGDGGGVRVDPTRAHQAVAVNGPRAPRDRATMSTISSGSSLTVSRSRSSGPMQAAAAQALAQPVEQAGPELRPTSTTGKWWILSRLDQVERLEELVERAEAAGQDDERRSRSGRT